MAFFEVISENFFGKGGKPLYHLDQFAERYPLILHGVSLSIGGPEPPSRAYLDRLKLLIKRVKPAWVSDHFCFCGAGGAHMHDLLPLPYTEQAARRVAERAQMVQDYLEVPFALENTSSYLTYTQSTMTEWDFIRSVVEQANVGLMFDVNNVYVSAYNHGFDPLTFIRSVPHERILQIHVAGHTNLGDYIIDTHQGPVLGSVLDLYRETIRLAGPISTLLEWDEDIPSFEVLTQEIQRIERVRQQGLSPNCAALAEGLMPAPDGLPRLAQPAATGWVQGGPHESLTTWHETPQADLLRAEP